MNEPIAELDQLNRYARTSEGRNAAKAIYHYKNKMLEIFTDRGVCKTRFVTTAVECRDCEGNGRYVDQYGFEHNHCWACESNGTARLKFAETTIGGIVWHTPYHHWPKRKYGDGPFYPVGWQPNQPGQPLEPCQAAALLGRVENWYWTSPDISHTTRDIYKDTTLGYCLFVGRKTGSCEACGAQEHLHNCVVRRDPFEATVSFCKRCFDLLRWDGLWIPSELTTRVPDVCYWAIIRQQSAKIFGMLADERRRLRQSRLIDQEIPF